MISGLVPAAIAVPLERPYDFAQRQDALAEEARVHRPHRDGLVVAQLHGVDPAAGVGRDRVEQAPLPARVPHVEDVAARAAGAPRELARVGERVHERQVLTQRMDHLDREADARFRRFGTSAAYASA
jgi:hypothetical protein